MEIKRIGRLYDLRIWFKRFDILFRYTTYPDENTTYHHRDSIFGIIRRPFRRLFWEVRLLLNKLKKKPREVCEGCGEGFVSYAIDEPNGKNYSIFVCDSCVDFYDRDFSRKLLEIEE